MYAIHCLCCCPSSRKDELFEIAHELYPNAGCSHVASASAFREAVLAQGDEGCVALAGFSKSGVSDINLCAAVVLDGCAREVVLVVDNASGSLRSRAMSAGITRVVEAGAPKPHPVREATQQSAQPGMPPTEQARDGAGASAPLVVLCSGRGGVGKTSITAVAAHIAASWGMRIALIDLDLANGNLFSCFGFKRGGDLALFDGTDQPAAAGLALNVCDGIDLWGPCALPETAETVSPHLPGLFSYARGHADLVLVDTSSTTTDAVAEALQHADRVVLVYDGRASSLAALARMGGLAVRLGVARTRIMRLENHADPYGEPDFSLGRAEVGLEVARPLRVFEGGREVPQMLEEGLAAELARYESDFSRSVASCLAQILVELGCLPDNDEALRASREPSVKKRFWRFPRTREAS